MKLSDYITQFFYEKGIRTIFGYQGGMITHLVDSISRHKDMHFVQVYHEQTGAIAAEGYARLKNKPGVCISTSGPGATNMITGIADAYFDSIPTIYITGQVNSYEYKYDKNIRQLGFQETDITSIVKTITKYTVMVDDASKIRYELEKAYHFATEGRQGPVLLDIPMNILRAEIDITNLQGYDIPYHPENNLQKDEIDKVVAMILKSRRPMILVGGGVISSGSEKGVESLITHNNIPFVTSLMGKGAVNEASAYYMGMVGSYGNRMANISTHEADLLIVLGSRLDTRQTGAKYEEFLKSGKIIHVDIDASELEQHRIKENRLKINCDVKEFITKIKPHIKDYKANADWITYCAHIKEKYNQDIEIERFVDNKSPYRILQQLNKYLSPNDVVTTDIGQNQMWAAQTIVAKNEMRFITSGGLAPMGFSMPVAIGAAFGSEFRRKIWAVAGDGGFHMSIQALMLISQYNLPISVLVINNESLGMITQFQELYFDSRFAGTDISGGYAVPNIESLAKAYNLKYYRICEDDIQNQNLMDDIFSQHNCIIEYVTYGKTKVSPKLEFDKPFNRPSPQLDDQELSEIRYKEK